MRDAVVEFQEFNRGFARRNPELLRLKVERMAASPFAFFRGTFHLYARDILDQIYEVDPRQPAVDVELDLVGDIHGENYGTFRTKSGVHYDINDFDETTQGRFDFDVRRLATSCVLAAQACSSPVPDAVQVALAFLSSYTDTLRRIVKKGRPADYDVSPECLSSCPAIDNLVREATAAKRPAFIARLTQVQKDRRRLVRSARYFNLPEDERAQALRLLEDFRTRMPPPSTPEFYHVEDVCGRVSGIGSMGRFRYVVLLTGKGTKEARNVLLEFKEARPSAYDIYRQRQDGPDALASCAERVIAMQRASQVDSNPWLGFARDGGMSFQVRELGPRDRRLETKELKYAAELPAIARVQAAILARVHARSAARAVGVSNPLSEQTEVDLFCQRILAFALAYADLARSDWKQFVGRRVELEHCEDWATAEPSKPG